MTEPKIIRTIVPIPVDEVKRYFSDKSHSFLFDYANSRIKGKPFLAYMGNNNLPSDIELSDEVTTEERFDLLLAYMESRVLVNSDTLNQTLATLLLAYANPTLAIRYEKCFLTLKELETFMHNNVEAMQRHYIFMHSCLFYMIYTYQKMDGVIKVKETLPHLTDPHYVGLNVAHLFNLPNFFSTMVASPEPEDLYFFTEQFDEPIYRGNKLFGFFHVENNEMPKIMLGMVDGQLPIRPEAIEESDIELAKEALNIKE